MRDFLDFFLPVLIACAAFAVGVIGIVWAYSATFGRWDCEQFSRITKMESEYSVVAGCFVRVDGAMIPKDAFTKRYIQDRHQVEIK